MKHSKITRRQFTKTSAALVGAGYFVSPSTARASTSPNEKLNIVAVGATNRAAANITGVSSENITAICDVDQNLLDKGCVKYPAARKYNDFRVMLEKEAEKCDAVVVGTPDHTHAPAAAMALRLKKHVYCEKPLTHTVKEARVLIELANKNKLVTQMGTQIHAGENYRRVVELVQANAIGEIREVHVWSGARYTGGKFTTGTPTPKGLNWDLWLGPAKKRAYSDGVHPFQWRKFWDYGTGALGDFGCHYMDLPFWALKLRHPTKVSAKGPPVDPVTPPAWCIVEYEFPKRGDLPPVNMTWYDSGKKPEILGTLRDKSGNPLNWGSGQLFIGSKGMILSDYGRHMLLPEEKFADFKRPEKTIPKSKGHHVEWLHVIKNMGQTTCNFDYSGTLTEAVLLGTVSYKSGQSIDWDGANLKVLNDQGKAQNLIHKEYRKGWKL